MAKEGLTLTDFYATQSICSASRASILTGCYSNRVDIHYALMPDSKKGLSTQETTIAEMLKEKGYKTGIFGKWHLGHVPELMPNEHGFDEFFGIPYSNDMWPKNTWSGFNFDPLPLYENKKIIDTLDDQSDLTTWITEKSVDFINRHKNNPFFLYVPHPQPHVPLQVSDKFKGKSKNGLYGDVIMEIDWSVGQILDALKENNLDQNTLVIFTSDNGPWLSYGNHAGSAEPLREGKTTTWEGGHRVPFIVRFPDKIPAGLKVKTPIMAIDVLPTIAEITNANLPKLKIDGKSVWNILSGKSVESPHKAYFFYYGYNELQAVRYGKWKLYFPHTYKTMKDHNTGRNGMPGKYNKAEVKEIELYDLSKDISESENIAHLYPEIVDEIEVLAKDMKSQLGDSLTDIEGKENRKASNFEK